MPHFNEADLPPGTPDQIIEYHRRQAMYQEDTINEIIGFFREQTPEQLVVLSRILHVLTHEDMGPKLAAHYEAWCDAALAYHHKVCHICGQDHTDALLRGEDPHADEKAPPSAVDVSQEIDRDFEYPPGIEPHFTRDQTEIMKIYNLDSVYDEIDGNLVAGGVICKNCGMRYPTPEDRAMKAVDDCPGCHKKAAFG